MALLDLEERFKLQVHTDLHEENGINLATNGKQLNLIVAKDDEANSIRLADRRVVFTHVTTTELTSYLRSFWRVPVVNSSGMSGAYDFALTLEPDAVATDSRESFGDRLRQAVQELGFTLQPTKVKRDVMVIDRIERPSAN